MPQATVYTIRVSRRALIATTLAVAALAVLAALPGPALAQKSQKTFGDSINLTQNDAPVAVAASADGKYVFVAGPNGVLVSEDHGRTGTWSQTIRLK